MKLIVGLGNPGDKYALTRHNFGFMAVEELGSRLGIRLSRPECQAQIGQGTLDGEKLVLALPQTYMNRSGQAVKGLLVKLGLVPQDLLVICDDLNLPLGALRIRPAGSAGGHNGLTSIINCLESDEFSRMRLGIGRPPQYVNTADYVLSPFAPAERETVRQVTDRSAEASLCIIRQGVQAAMNQFNS